MTHLSVCSQSLLETILSKKTCKCKRMKCIVWLIVQRLLLTSAMTPRVLESPTQSLQHTCVKLTTSPFSFHGFRQKFSLILICLITNPAAVSNLLLSPVWKVEELNMIQMEKVSSSEICFCCQKRWARMILSKMNGFEFLLLSKEVSDVMERKQWLSLHFCQKS